MATTPTGYGRFIGRVGALAVALGIGAAIANSPGIAWAQDGPSGASDSSSGSEGSSNAGSTTGSTDTPDSSDSGSADGSDQSGDIGNDDNAEDADGEDSADVKDSADVEDTEEGDSEEEESPGDSDDSSPAPTPPDESDETSDGTHATSDTLDGRDDEELSDDGGDSSQPQSTTASQTVVISQVDDDPEPEAHTRIAAVTDSESPSEHSTAPLSATQAAETSTQETPVATPATTGLGGLVSTVLSALGFGPQAASGPVAPPQPPMLWAMLGWVRREIGHITAPFTASAATPVATLVAEDVSIAADSPLATPEQLEAERLATQTANSLPVALMKLVLRQQFLSAANNLYPNGLDEGSLAALDDAVNEYAMAASFQQLLLDSMNPNFVTQVAPPHIWFGQNVPGGRILYDNPDTVYRFAGVNGASEYEIRGQFHNWSDEDARPANITFSVLEGLAGTTSTVLTVGDDFEVDENGNFVITVSREAANGNPNHLQLTGGSTIIAARDTLGNWNDENPMSLSIARVGGPPNSLFAQIGGFAFLGQFVSSNPILTTLVSLVPPLPYMPPVVRGVFTAAILIVRGAGEQSKYMELATTDPETGEARDVNTVSQPASNAEFLANQLQSNGHFQLEDNQAIVLTIDPGTAKYFVVPTYDIWTITDNYWDQPTSLNNEQAIENVDENGVPTGTYTVVISPTDPLAANWISTGGLKQGTIAIRFQDLDLESEDLPRILDQRVMTHDELRDFLPEDDFITVQEREDQLELRKAGFDKRWAPYPQP